MKDKELPVCESCFRVCYGSNGVLSVPAVCDSVGRFSFFTANYARFHRRDACFVCGGKDIVCNGYFTVYNYLPLFWISRPR